MVRFMVAWEALVLAERGRLRLEPSPEEWVRDALEIVPLHDAPVSREIALESRRLELDSTDPADRFIAATARLHELTLVTEDRALLGLDGVTLLANR